MPDNPDEDEASDQEGKPGEIFFDSGSGQEGFFGRQEFNPHGIRKPNPYRHVIYRSYLIHELGIYLLGIKKDFPKRVESFDR
jgi:hypothetical protein